MEKALRNALRQSSPDFLEPALPAPNAGKIMRDFIVDRDMRLYCVPKELIQPTNDCKAPIDQRPTDRINPDDWTPIKDEMGKDYCWEHTSWLNIDRVGEVITRGFYERDSSQYEESLDLANDERVRALLLRKAPYVALVNSRGEFQALLDRQKLAVMVAETMTRQ